MVGFLEGYNDWEVIYFVIPILAVGKYSVPSLATQASTFKNSETKEGMLQRSTAVFPLITYSETTSAS